MTMDPYVVLVAELVVAVVLVVEVAVAVELAAAGVALELSAGELVSSGASMVVVVV
jgi:hypothetical protein